MEEPKVWPSWIWLRIMGVAGVLCAVGIAPYVALFARAYFRRPTLAHVIDLLFLWQTQTGAALAVAAALTGAAAILYQTAATRDGEERRRSRSAEAQRAVLPLTLTELSIYADSCAEVYESLAAQPDIRQLPLGLAEFPRLPDGLAAGLREIIEVSVPQHARPLIVLLRQVQIQHARMMDVRKRVAGRPGRILVRSNLVTGAVDVAEIYARCENLFAYSRGSAHAPADAISAADVASSLRKMSFGDAFFVGEVEDGINRLASGGDWPRRG